MFDFNIITFQRSINFGAALQTYALQEFVTKQGYSVGVYDYVKPKPISVNNTVRAKMSKVLSSFTRDDRAAARQNDRYREFRRQYLRLNLETDSRVFISGSDQVWNLSNSMDSMFFLRFLDESVCKASYAASMAKSAIPEDRKRIVSEYLDSFDAISVREEGLKESLSSLCSKEVSVHVDPTLLHDSSFYSKISKPIDGIPEKYILAYILHIPKNGNKLIKWLKKESGLPVVLLDSSGNVGMVVKHNLLIRDAGPLEFLHLFKNAECIVTTSFHGTCFSLLFEKEFYSIVNPDSPGRISNLLQKCEISPIFESDGEFVRRTDIDWNHVRNVLENERNRSRLYINGVFEISKNKKVNKLVGTVRDMLGMCTGCAACEENCPTDSIRMVLNDKGFYEPQIDEKTCLNCNKCLQSCPLNSKQVVWPRKAYYGWNSSTEVLFKSSSGGAFYSLANEIIKRSGVVFGAAYTDDWKDVLFQCTEDVPLVKLQKSKYTVSSASGVYRDIRKYLNEGRLVLFAGTPCQCSGVKSVFGDKYENLITCDFVCGGMPSLLFYREHLDHLQNKYHSSITSLDFRPKEWGWGRYRLSVLFENNKKYVKRDFADSYFKCFNEKASVRHVCEGCPYYHFHRSDFTIADFWGYRLANIKKHKRGMSLVVCNNSSAERLFSEINDFEKHEIPMEYTEYAIRDKIPNAKKLKSRDQFFELAKSRGFEDAACQMYDTNEMHYIFKKIRDKMHL